MSSKYSEAAKEVSILLANGETIQTAVIVARPMTRMQIFKRSLFCLCYQINQTYNAWYCLDWHFKISELYMSSGVTNLYHSLATSNVLCERLKSRSLLRELRHLLYKRIGDMKDFSTWLLEKIGKDEIDDIYLELIYFIQVDYSKIADYEALYDTTNLIIKYCDSQKNIISIISIKAKGLT